MNSVFKVVHFPDSFNSNSVAHFHKEIELMVEAGIKIVLLDLKNLKFVNSSDLMAILSIFRVVQTAGGKLFFCSLNEQVKILFELAGVDQFFETFTSLDEFNSTMLVKK